MVMVASPTFVAASVVACWIGVNKEEVLIFNFEIGYNLVVILCGKLYCFFSKMITWHLFIGVLGGEKHAFKPWLNPIYTLK